MTREEELKKELRQIESMKKEENLQDALLSATTYEHSGYMVLLKNSIREHIDVTWYKDAFIGKEYESNPKVKVWFNASTMHIAYDINYNIVVSYRDKCKIEFDPNNFHYNNIEKKTKITQEHFKGLVKLWKGINKDFIQTAKQDNIWEYTWDDEDAVYRNNPKKQKELLDIPYIELTRDEAWLIGSNVFLKGDVFLITPNSLKWIKERVSHLRNNGLRTSNYLNTFGYTKTNSRMEGLMTLLVKVDNAEAKTRSQ